MKQFKHAWAAAFAVFALVVAPGCAGGGEATASSDGGGAAKATSDVVARVGDHTFTREEVDQRALTLAMKSFYEVFDARQRAANMLVAEYLVDQVAAERGVTPEEVLKTEVHDKLPTVTPDQVKAFYDENKARMGGQSLEQVGPQIQAFLASQNLQKAELDYLDKLKEGKKISIDLEAPRVEVPVADTDPSWGPADAPVTIVEFSDFQCPYCAQVGPTLKQIKDAYGDKVRIVYRHYPLPSHPLARPAAEASDCAQEQGKFWEYHDAVFANNRALTPEKLKELAGTLGLDQDQFNQCVDGAKYRMQVQEDVQVAQRLGVQSTPSIFVNGQFLVGAQPFDSFKQVIDRELAR